MRSNYRAAWRTSLVLPVLAGAALLADSPSAQAQSIFPVRLKVGILNATDGDVRNAVGTPLFSGEIDVALPSLSAGKTYISAGYIERGSKNTNLRVIPLTISRVYSPPNPASGLTGNVYYGGGVGAYLTRAKTNGQTENKTLFGGFGVVGYQFPVPYFVEAKYHQTFGGVRGLSPNGIQVSLGRRF